MRWPVLWLTALVFGATLNEVAYGDRIGVMVVGNAADTVWSIRGVRGAGT